MVIPKPSNIPLAGVIGNPIGHSLSPKIHNFWISKIGLNGHYIPMDISSNILQETIKFLPKIGFKGLNVTLPHKTNIIALVDNLTDRAALIGAVNTIHFNSDGLVVGDNTDAFGFIENIKRNSIDWDPKVGPAMVFGAGGAARAIVWALLAEGVPEVRIVNRTKTKAAALGDILGAKVKVFDVMDATQNMGDIAILVNATSLGMVGNGPFNYDISNLNRNSMVIDLVYNPLRTDLLIAAEEIGLKTINGLGMLLYQAVPGFEKWFGHKPKVTPELIEHVKL